MLCPSDTSSVVPATAVVATGVLDQPGREM